MRDVEVCAGAAVQQAAWDRGPRSTQSVGDFPSSHLSSRRRFFVLGSNDSAECSVSPGASEVYKEGGGRAR